MGKLFDWVEKIIISTVEDEVLEELNQEKKLTLKLEKNQLPEKETKLTVSASESTFENLEFLQREFESRVSEKKWKIIFKILNLIKQ